MQTMARRRLLGANEDDAHGHKQQASSNKAKLEKGWEKSKTKII
jgi:hypothetical protein